MKISYFLITSFLLPGKYESSVCEYDDVIYIYKYNFCENFSDIWQWS